MANGVISGAWGYSPQMVAGLNPIMEKGNTPLSYQLGLTSTPMNYGPGGQRYTLSNTNNSFYNPAFGKKRGKRSMNEQLCRQFLQNPSINPKTGRTIKKYGSVYNDLTGKCSRYLGGGVSQRSIGISTGQQTDEDIVQGRPVYQDEVTQGFPNYYYEQPSVNVFPSATKGYGKVYQNGSELNKNLFNRFSVVYDNCSEKNHNVKKLILKGKEFTRGTPAYYDSNRNQGVISGMGCKQITVKLPNNREKHIKLEKFFEYNS